MRLVAAIQAGKVKIKKNRQYIIHMQCIAFFLQTSIARSLVIFKSNIRSRTNRHFNQRALLSSQMSRSISDAQKLLIRDGRYVSESAIAAKTTARRQRISETLFLSDALWTHFWLIFYSYRQYIYTSKSNYTVNVGYFYRYVG